MAEIIQFPGMSSGHEQMPIAFRGGMSPLYLGKNEYAGSNFRRLADTGESLGIALKQGFVQADPPPEQAKDVKIELLGVAASQMNLGLIIGFQESCQPTAMVEVVMRYDRMSHLGDVNIQSPSVRVKDT